MSIVKLATLDYDPEVEADCIINVNVGELSLWFVMCAAGDHLIAFQMDDGEGKTCWTPHDDADPDIRELTLSFPGRRCSRCVDGTQFVADWNRRTTKYLFPKKIGKLRIDLPLNKDTPLDILADWLQDQECDTAANILRAHVLTEQPK